MPDYELIVKHLDAGRPHLQTMTKILAEIGAVVERLGSLSSTGVAELDQLPRHDLKARSLVADKYAIGLAGEVPKLERLVALYDLHTRELEAHSDMVHDRLWYAPDSSERIDREATGYVDAIADMALKARAALQSMDGVRRALEVAAKAWPTASEPAGRLAGSLSRLEATSAPLLRMGDQMSEI